MMLDNLERDDVIYAILHSYSVEREADDELEVDWKYIIIGELEDGFRVYTVGKVLRDEHDKELYRIITAHAQD